MLLKLLVVVAALALLRLFVVVPQFGIFQRKQTNAKLLKNKSLMILLGSGGHTGEMLRLIETVDSSELGNIQWIFSSGDTTSASRLKDFLQAKSMKNSNTIYELKRARKVGESITSSIKSTLLSLIQTFNLFLSSKEKPDILLLNGPATAVPLCYVSTLLNYLGLSNTKIVYVESLARVNGLSLSGKLCYPLSHRFLVQWKTLKELYPRSEYYGVLV